MAIALGTTNKGAASGTVTVSINPSGSNLLLLVAFDYTNTSDLVTSVTFGGVGMTRLVTTNNGASSNFIYGLLNPTTGAQNVVVTTTAGNVRVSCLTYTGVSQSGLPDANTTNSSATTTSLTTSLNSVADNCWFFLHSVGQSVETAGTGSTERTNAGTGSSSKTFDSNGPQTPAGSYSMTVTQASNLKMGHVMISFAPFVASASTGNFLLMF